MRPIRLDGEVTAPTRSTIQVVPRPERDTQQLAFGAALTKIPSHALTSLLKMPVKVRTYLVSGISAKEAMAYTHTTALILQRKVAEGCAPLQLALAMGEVGHMIAPLIVPDQFQCGGGIKVRFG